MMPCSICGERLRGDRDKLGARCPNCREPLFEQPRDPHVESDPQTSLAGSRCTAHPNNGAVGTCQRCGNYLCCVCWTRWHDHALCAACLSRALEVQETTPAEARAHLRQAILAIVAGIVAWGIAIGSFILMGVGVSTNNQLLAGFGFLILLASTAPSVLGVGQGAAAIRTRGDHMILATLGLLIAGLHAGMVVGLFTLVLWQNL